MYTNNLVWAPRLSDVHTSLTLNGVDFQEFLLHWILGIIVNLDVSLSYVLTENLFFPLDRIANKYNLIFSNTQNLFLF